jgi:thiol-disulfide isomerase/thioredoxin
MESVMLSLSIGPFALSVERLLLLLAFLVALFAGWVSSRRGGKRPDGALCTTLLLAVAGARLGFVLRYPAAYLSQPVQIMDIRDGGFWWVGGLVAGLACVLFFMQRQPAVRRPLAIGLVTGALFWSATALPLQRLQQTSATLPSLSFDTLSGEAVNLRQFRGQPMVINLWASWCPPCVREMPLLAEAQRSTPGVHFLFANLGEEAQSVARFVRPLHIAPESVLLDQRNQLGAHYGTRALPTTLFIDGAGRLRETHLGELSAATLQAKLAPIRPQ